MNLSNNAGRANLRPLKFAASLAALALTASAVHAQTFNYAYYATDFENLAGHTDTFNNAPVTAPYNSPTTSNTDPLSGQGGATPWTSNDQTAQTNTPGAQVGQSDFVGANGGNFGGTQFGALGGIYRDTRFVPTAGGAGDVIPSVASNGIVSLNHALPALLTSAGQFAFNTDFVINKQNVVNNTNDTFSFRLGTGTANLLSINFAPTVTAGNVGGRATGPGLSADIGSTIGGNQFGTGGTAGTATNSVLFLNAQYHLTVMVTTGAAPTFQAIFTPQGGGANFSFNGSLAGAGITPNSITQLGVLWNLADKTTITPASNGAAAGYTNAGSNYLAFDNLQATVPEPSTYAMMVLGFVGLGLVIRARRQQA